MNLATFLVAAVVAAVFLAIVISGIRKRKKGGGSCSCGCSCGSCGMADACHPKSNDVHK
ncbi:FeoB-associated Cys-rich membrane protein [Butyricicoccus sp.]|uniref:FeoB-associated Cys-rich membrane protein n=1 Tax=Butyricicoccus sp. TaxID=2049021 RepID=UPI003735502B